MRFGITAAAIIIAATTITPAVAANSQALDSIRAAAIHKWAIDNCPGTKAAPKSVETGFVAVVRSEPGAALAFQAVYTSFDALAAKQSATAVCSLVAGTVATPASAGSLAATYAHLPVSDWAAVDWAQQSAVAGELSRTRQWGDPATVKVCIDRITRDPRNKGSTLAKAFDACTGDGRLAR